MSVSTPPRSPQAVATSMLVYAVRYALEHPDLADPCLSDIVIEEAASLPAETQRALMSAIGAFLASDLMPPAPAPVRHAWYRALAALRGACRASAKVA